MELRFWIDPETDLPHIFGHGVTEDEVRQVVRRPGLNVAGDRNSRTILGQTEAGRHLKVVLKAPMKKQRIPKGWTAEQIRALAERHDTMTVDEQVAEIESALAG